MKMLGFKELVYVGKFRGELREVLHKLKYEDIRVVAGDVAVLLAQRIKQYKLPEGVLVPVPLSKSRQKERGYNQTRLISQSLAKLLGWTNLDALERTRNTTPQTKLSRRQRLKNVEDIFVCKYKFTSSKRVVYVLDDVLTTGATIKSAVDALKKSGAKKVTGIVVAVD